MLVDFCIGCCSAYFAAASLNVLVTYIVCVRYYFLPMSIGVKECDILYRNVNSRIR